MLDSLKHLLPAYAAHLTCIALICGIFRYANATVSEEIRLRVALWMLGGGLRPHWHEYVPILFLKLFGTRVFSWKAARVVACLMLLFGLLLHVAASFLEDSGVADVNSVAISALNSGGRDAFVPAGDNVFVFHFEKRDGDVIILGAHLLSLSSTMSADRWLILLLILLIYNFPIEYLSVLKTRWLIGIAYRRPDRVSWLSGALVAEMLTTALIAFCSAKIISEAFSLVNMGTVPIASSSVYVTLLRQVIISMALPFAHTLWLMLCVVMALLSKLCVWAGRGMPLISRYLSEERIEREPITLIGELTAAIYFVATALTRVVA